MTAPLISLEAEQSVIGCVLAAGSFNLLEGADEALERLGPQHFGDPVHARIWAAMMAERRKSSVVDPIKLHGLMATDPGYIEYGALPYLIDLADKAPSWAVDAHIALVLDRAARRSIASLGESLTKAARDTTKGDPDAILADMEHDAAEIARDGVSKPKAVPVGLTALDALEAAWRGEYAGVSVGLDCLDHVTGGIRQDDVWFIGGRTSMGKSVCGLSLARGIAEQGRGVMMFSLEMPLREVQCRLVADIAYDRDHSRFSPDGNVRYGDLLKGRGTDAIKGRAINAARKLASLPFAVTDEGGLTIDDIRMQAQRQMRAWDKAGVQRGAILIDHIGLVRPTRRSDSKAAETAETVNELKALAKYLKAPIIALCQVNRNTENRADKRPTMADLNWSGAIEQIADMVCLLYRESYYLERSPDEVDQADAVFKQHDLELLIQKNRSGPSCTLKAFIDIASNAVRDVPDAERQRA